MEETLILKVLALFIGFYMAWNIGANDVSNAMGTSVGSKALTLAKAVFLASILEFSGAFFLGSPVSETIQSGIIETRVFQDETILYMLGMIAALISTAIWINIASFLKLPASTTHAIVGAVVGFGAIIGGIHAIYWNTLFSIFLSWLLVPPIAALVAYSLFKFLQKQVLYTLNPARASKKLLPFFVFFVFLIFSIILFSAPSFRRHFDLPFLFILGLLFLIPTIASILAFFLSRSIQIPIEFEFVQKPFFPNQAVSLEKAAKHLQRTMLGSSGKMKKKVSELLEETRSLLSNIKQQSPAPHYTASYTIVEKIFGYLQICSACMVAFAHGANDVANAIGPIGAIFSSLKGPISTNSSPIPLWLLTLGGFGIVFGLATWGWRVIETVGKKITELTPTRGFAAEISSALIILIVTKFGLPISTTQALVGGVLGVGLAGGMQALNLRVIRNIILTWVITIPVCAFLSICFFYLLKLLFIS